MQSIRQGLPTLRAACPACGRNAVRSPPRRFFSSAFRPFDQATSSAAASSSARTTFSTQEAAMKASRERLYAARAERSRSVLLYSTGALILSFGVTYAAVPLYRAFCSATGFAGTPITDPTRFSPDRLYTTPETEGRKRITVHFQSDASETLPWTFKPLQKDVKVLPGETALAFYRAKNEGTEDLIGIATYNMTPEKIAPYFAKVECFCFEEQKIRAGEEVDLPVFFFIDRDVIEDPGMDTVDDVILSYTFFRARRNQQGHAVPDAPDSVVLASQGFDKYEHVQAK